MNRIKSIIVKAVAGVLALYVLWLGFEWSAMRVYVGPDEALVITSKFGSALPAGLVVAPEGSHYKGVQQEVLGPGRYFFDPVEYEWQVVKQVEVAAGDPDKWEWDEEGNLKDPATAPMVALISLKQSLKPGSAPEGSVLVPDGYKGVQEGVLTPGTYKLNPALMTWTLAPAVVIPPGSVGVVTRLVGDVGTVSSASLTEIRTAASQPTADSPPPTRLVVGQTQRGILNRVLQPGIYYLNPKMVKVTVVPVGYDQITLDHNTNTAVRFYSYDGYQVEADFTVVWGRTPEDAPNIVANIGNVAKVRTNVIEPAMKAACQNEGAKYTAKELIQGDTRSKFQLDLSGALEKHIEARNIHVLLVLIRNIAVKDNSGRDQTKGLLATIQRANIEIERDLTFKQQTQTAVVQAELEQANKLVDVNREMVASETKVKVAGTLAEGQKKAAEIDAQRDLTIAAIKLEASKLNAQRTEILGKAAADVEQMKRSAEAQGAKLLVDALGSPEAYNRYIFAKNFDPTEVRLIFSGPGTFWTDLKTFEQVGAAKMIQQSAKPPQ
ncbi:MAG TPA: SPFH domain-containing protein [Tepidisphaeraceae bacterium]|nr:SPFH domain-containing protein [Tepidisphaeraceae bacterium]